MKLLQINTTVNSGSTGRIAEDIGIVSQKQGFYSYIAYGQGNRPSRSELVKIGTQKDIYMHGLQTLLLDRHGLASVNATKEFVGQLHEISPDVIGLHNLHGYYINYPILLDYIKRANVPVVWTFHDCWPFTGHCAYFERVGCKKWKTHCHECPLQKYYPKSYRDRSFKNFIDKQQAFLGIEKLKIITPSHWLKDLVKESFLKDYDVEVIHNGIDLEKFRVLDNITKEKIILGVASIWDDRKGLKDFIRLNEVLPEGYKIVLIGLKTKQIKNLPSGIVGIKRTESIDELVEWYNRASVFVNPTYVDNFPTTNIEALACGTPVITYNTGGSPEAIDCNTGVVVEKGNVEELLCGVMEVLQEGSDYYTQNCRERAEKYFNKEDRYLDYLNIYKSLTGKNL